METLGQKTLYALSFALDAVEHELKGVKEGHGKRVAWLSERMARETGYTESELIDLAGIAILHDNALSSSMGTDADEGTHCLDGEKNIQLLSFCSDVSNVVLYHHERADGGGPFHKKADEVPLSAQIIHFADQLDNHFKLTRLCCEDYDKLKAFVHGQEGIMFSPEVVTLFDRAITPYVICEV